MLEPTIGFGQNMGYAMGVEQPAGPSATALATALATVVRTRDVLAADVDGELVLMSVEQGLYFGLDAIGADIWGRLEEPVRVADLCASLAADYEGDPATIERDVLALLDRMAARGLVAVTP